MPSKKVSGRMSKQREIEKKRRKKRKIILIFIIFIILIVGIIVFLLKSPRFALIDIEITGNNQLTTEQIYTQSGLELGKSIFSSLDIITKVRLKQNGYIEDAKVSKKIPNIIVIDIKERQKNFQIKTQNNYYIYIDEQGYIIDYSEQRENLIVITGMDITEENLDGLKRLEKEDLNIRMENILHIKQETEQIGIYEKITEIQVEDEYIIKLENEGITINLGNCTDLKNRMYYVKTILEKEEGKKGTINVNGNLNEGFLPYFTENY